MGRGVASYSGMETVFVDNEEVYGEYLCDQERYEGIEHEDDYQFRLQDMLNDVNDSLPSQFSALDGLGKWDRDTNCRILAESPFYQLLWSDEETMFGFHFRIHPAVFPDGMDADTPEDDLVAAIKTLRQSAVEHRIQGLHHWVREIRNEIEDIKRLQRAWADFDSTKNTIWLVLHERYHLRVRDTAWTTREFVPIEQTGQMATDVQAA